MPPCKDMPPADIGARAIFEWLPGERFLIQRWEVPMPEAPDGIAIIRPETGRPCGDHSCFWKPIA